MDNQNTKLYYFYNNHHEILLDQYFTPSFNKHVTGITLVGKKFIQSSVNCLFGTKEYKELLTDKVKYLIDLIEGPEKNRFFIFSDVDVQFFGDVSSKVNNMMKKNYDIVFQLECDNPFSVNFGFMLINGNEATLNFWKALHDVLLSPNCPTDTNDQLEGNKLLHMINYTTFDKSIWNWSQGRAHNEILLHHANCVSIVSEKIEQLENIKKFINEKGI